MTRSKKGSKPPGYDFWSKRPKSSHNDKDLTHRAERREGKVKTKYKCDRCGAVRITPFESGCNICEGIITD